MALDMALKAIIAISQKGFDQEDFHAVMRATAKKDIITFIAALLKTGCTGNKGEGLLPNMKFDEIAVSDYNAMVFIGGSAGLYCRAPLALRLAKDFYESGKIVAATGDAVPVLASAGVLEGRVVACDEACRNAVVAEISEEAVFADGRIITGKSGSGAEFGERLSELMKEIGMQKAGKFIDL